MWDVWWQSLYVLTPNHLSRPQYHSNAHYIHCLSQRFLFAEVEESGHAALVPSH